jgi:hypothetical protein
VQGREYGPADIQTLREWKAEGRLLPANDARRANVDLWTTAAEIPGLFDGGGRTAASTQRLTQPPLQVPHRNLGQVLAETFQIYRKGFFQFLGLTLLILLPSICSQLTTEFVKPPQASNVDLRSTLAGGFALLMFIIWLVMWPIYIAGIQILTAEIARGHRPSLGAVLNDAAKFWPRVAGLCIFVFIVFALLSLFGLAIAAITLASAASLLLIPVAMGLLVLQIWMFGRFFVSILFWQQFAVLENAEFIESLRESRDLARSGRDLQWFQRPLWRGTIIASIWFAFVLAITLAAQWGTLQHYLHLVLTTQDPQALLQKMTEAQEAVGFDIPAFALSVLEKILRPLLGIAFVIVYLDSKLEGPSHVEPIVSAGEGDAVR